MSYLPHPILAMDIISTIRPFVQLILYSNIRRHNRVRINFIRKIRRVCAAKQFRYAAVRFLVRTPHHLALLCKIRSRRQNGFFCPSKNAGIPKLKKNDAGGGNPSACGAFRPVCIPCAVRVKLLNKISALIQTGRFQTTLWNQFGIPDRTLYSRRTVSANNLRRF